MTLLHPEFGSKLHNTAEQLRIGAGTARELGLKAFEALSKWGPDIPDEILYPERAPKDVPTLHGVSTDEIEKDIHFMLSGTTAFHPMSGHHDHKN